MFRGKDIYLSYLTTDDSKLMLEWINTREDVLFNSAYKPVHETQHKHWFEKTTSSNEAYIFAIRTIENDALIGNCQLCSVNSIYKSAELKIRIGEEAQRGKGFGTQAVKLILKFAFDDLNLNRVYLNVFESNIRACDTYLKCGFVKEGVLRKAAYIDGKYVDTIIMGILKEEFASPTFS
ncbi:MAG: GNAT family N-acetyltransferase [Clostridia bacterium]|nr:GNAT family N-acetyltransferase [Clostridia bacterium]